MKRRQGQQTQLLETKLLLKLLILLPGSNVLSIKS